MSEALIEVDEFTGSVIVPEDGDPRDAASVVAGFQPLANRTLYLANRLKGAQTFTETVPLIISMSDVAGGAAIWQGRPFGGPSNDMFTIDQVNVSASGRGTIALVTPKVNAALKITSVVVTLHPSGGHGALPTLPSTTLYRQPVTGGAVQQVAFTTDGSGSVGAYEAIHDLTITPGGGGHVVLANNAYYVSVEGETGGNAIVGLSIVGIRVTWAPA